MNKDIKKSIWWGYLHEDLKELIQQTFFLIRVIERWEGNPETSSEDERFHDYAFVVFPAAKAYEGFLKNLFLDMGFITEDDFYGKRFRVGKALNPALEKRYRKRQGVYDKVVNFCGGKELADQLWKTWRECRNVLFHWFPNERNAIDFGEAREKIELILSTMNKSFKQCKIKIDENIT